MCVCVYMNVYLLLPLEGPNWNKHIGIVGGA
jgi:hypothetical protein